MTPQCLHSSLIRLSLHKTKITEKYEDWCQSMNITKTRHICVENFVADLKIFDDNKIKKCYKYKYLYVELNNEENRHWKQKNFQGSKVKL